MAGNTTHPAEISLWKIKYDPSGYENSQSWYELVDPVEDILQLHHVASPLIIDVGFYGTSYCVLVVEHQDWESPIARVVTTNPASLNEIINDLVTAYANSNLGIE